MDTFFEQIIPIKKTFKTVALIIGIWVLACLLSVVFFVFLTSFYIVLIAGAIYGAYLLTTLFNVEYEYIITNGVMDIDKITNKAKRKRILSFDLSGVSRLEKYNPSILNNMSGNDVVFACDADDDNAFLMVAEREGKKASYLVFSPNDKIKSAIIKFVPKFVSNSAFK